MRAWVMWKAADLIAVRSKAAIGSCWAIAYAATNINFAMLHEAGGEVPEIGQWEEMHKPVDWDKNNVHQFWLGHYASNEANELREVLLRECAFNLMEQGYDEDVSNKG